VWVSGNSWVFDRFISKDNPDRRPFLQSMLTDNPGIDADEYRKALAELPEVERLRLEEGSWDALEIPGALWSFRDIAHIDTDDPDDTADVRIIGVDPSVSAEGKNHDECGIVMGSLTNGRITVERDFSGHFHPDDWAKLVVREYHRHGCSRVVCEDNQGGALVFSAIGNAADAIGMDRPHVVKVRATESKEARAIPVIAAYRDGKVAHLLGLRGGRMEVQMTSWVPGIGPSPDRVDALVWLVRNGLFGDGTAVTYHAPDLRDRLMRPRGPAIHSASGFRL
jgi:phage terminase large subunit-like protein